jgi:hypothetical protein
MAMYLIGGLFLSLIVLSQFTDVVCFISALISGRRVR